MATTSHNPQRDKSRMPSNSVFYDKIVPLLLAGMAILMVLIVLVALGFLVGLVPY